MIMLTEEQKLAILTTKDKNPKVSLNELVNAAYPTQLELDGRSKEGREVRAFLTEKNILARASHEYTKKEKLEFTDEQKEFITNNCKIMKAFELARVLFNNPKISNLHNETKAVQEFLKVLPVRETQGEIEDNEISNEFKPPKTLDRALARINKYVMDGFDKNNLKPLHKKCITAFINYMHTHRIAYQMGVYSDDRDKLLFESSFVRYTYDKPDLTQEEVDQYIVLCTDIVIGATIQRRIEMLQELLDESALDSEGRKISMSLVESISTGQTEYNQCVNRQQKLLSDLKVKRSDRLENQIKETASILNLVALWKDEENRNNMVRLAELRKGALKNELVRLSSLDEIKCKILGISEDEILNG